MELNPTSFPFLSYVMSRWPAPGARTPVQAFDVEQPPPSAGLQVLPPAGFSEVETTANPKVLESMTRVVSDVAQTRSVLQALGPCPDHETVEAARKRITDIETSLSKQLEDIVLSPRPSDTSIMDWRAHMADKEAACRQEAERERGILKSIIQLDEIHTNYERLLREAEAKLVAIVEKANSKDVNDDEVEDEENNSVRDCTDEAVVGILRACSEGMEVVDLSNRRLKLLPEAFGRIPGLRLLNLSSNQLQTIPDSICALSTLEELNISSNLIEMLPDSIGLLQNLRILNVSGNKLGALPDTICQCRSLVELDASFNRLTYLPTNIGLELVNLRRLCIQLNKIRTLPFSVGELKSLQYLDAHFNELTCLPDSFGKLSNLEILNLSSNFTDLVELPITFGELTNLIELDLSNNQIHALPITFGRLENLTKLNLDQNPLLLPPPEVVNQGVVAVKDFMAKIWLDMLLQEEEKVANEMQEQSETAWWKRSSSWLRSHASAVGQSVSEYLSPRARDPDLDQQL